MTAATSAQQVRKRRGSYLLSFSALLTLVATLSYLKAPDRDQALILNAASSNFEPGSQASIDRTKGLLLNADAVFFDVDSTVVTTEGIDLMGKCFGVMKEIAEMTKMAMNGNVKFQDAMADRLQLMADHGMNRKALDSCVKREGVPQWSPGVQEVVKMLHKQGTDVYLLSGGFKNMLFPVALELHIPQKNIFANEILFDESGKYLGFDRTNPTSASGGKPLVLSKLKRKHKYNNMVMIGDGATDMEARRNGPASAFIGYGGVVVREKVKAGADWFIYSFKELLDVLPKGTQLML
eukprot:TRINITY_DN74114_c0_g1_i1.p1 TRINITY_DN74114_c0_g1~~TRINITY_DN74114_c0_g1_i1.p1  ORF type:complete len:294 (+),score=41.56 TRINITY_DN74114_c0_g1_i1:124-1005(+)